MSFKSKIKHLFTSALIISAISYTQASSARVPSLHDGNNLDSNKIDRVIYITIDGVRWQNVFSDDFFKVLKSKYTDAKYYGAPGSNTYVEVASIPISLPSYHSQMTGQVLNCAGNDCGRTYIETFPEALVNRLNFAKRDVTVFSAWDRIHLSSESISDTIHTNIGIQDGFATRFDDATFEAAYDYYKQYQPKFMWLSLNDADEEAHAINKKGYEHALFEYDTMFDQLFTLLKDLNIYDKTAIVITTDHGRGNGAMWSSHGVLLPESKRTWAITINTDFYPIEIKNGITYYSTLSVRPTVERIFYS